MSWPSKRIFPPSARRGAGRAADRRLAAAGLADKAERLAAADLEADVVDRLDVADVAVEDDPALDREPDLEVLDLDKIARATLTLMAAALPRLCHSSTGTGLKQATMWPGSISRSCGTSSRDCSTSKRQRGWNGQALGGRSMSRGAPWIGVQPLLARRVEARDRLQEAQRVRVPRAGEELLGRAGLHEHPGVHHVHALAHAGDDAEIVRDQDQCRVPVCDELAGADRGSAPGSSRRARSSARRRSGASARRRAPSRSSRAAACRPRTGAGSP